MVDQLGHLVDEVVIVDSVTSLGKAPVAQDEPYMDEFEGEASASPNRYRDTFSVSLLAQVAPCTGPWLYDDGEM